MDYIIAFLEGIITFISPCLLPMLPVYISYFTGQTNIQKNNSAALTNALGFVLGFTIVFVSLGAFAGAAGHILKEYQTIIHIVSGIVVIVFGLNFLEIIRIPLLNTTHQLKFQTVNLGFSSSVLFGVIFSLGWTPCVGAFLGSALMLAATSGESLKGVLMLLSFSLGLGIPFIVSAVLIEQLTTAFDFIKKNYRIIELFSGSLLILIGILMITGWMGYFLSLLTF